MTTNWHDLIQRYISGTITEAETEALEQQLKTDAALRDWYLDALNLDSALEAAAESAQTALSLPVPFSQRVLTPVGATSTRWQGWRPLAAAAAGIVFGMFCTSVVFGFGARSVEKVVSLLQESFESGPAPLVKGLPQDVNLWSGDYSDDRGEV
jgi:anti-sigma factor RsiW